MQFDIEPGPYLHYQDPPKIQDLIDCESIRRRTLQDNRNHQSEGMVSKEICQQELRNLYAFTDVIHHLEEEATFKESTNQDSVRLYTMQQ